MIENRKPGNRATSAMIRYVPAVRQNMIIVLIGNSVDMKASYIATSNSSPRYLDCFLCKLERRKEYVAMMYVHQRLLCWSQAWSNLTQTPTLLSPRGKRQKRIPEVVVAVRLEPTISQKAKDNHGLGASFSACGLIRELWKSSILRIGLPHPAVIYARESSVTVYKAVFDKIATKK